MKIIAISGKAENGKDSFANILKNKLGKHNVLILHCADFLKYIVANYLGGSYEKNKANRTIWQQFGTEEVRSKYPDYWIIIIKKIIEALSIKERFDYFIIPDIRFINEIEILKKSFNKAIIVRVNRLNYKSSLTKEQQNHISETQLDNYEFDYIIESESGLDKLEKEVDNFVRYLKEGEQEIRRDGDIEKALKEPTRRVI